MQARYGGGATRFGLCRLGTSFTFVAATVAASPCWVCGGRAACSRRRGVWQSQSWWWWRETDMQLAQVDRMGLLTETWSDATVVREANGSTVHTFPSGRVIKQLASGMTIETCAPSADGPMTIITSPAGDSVASYKDGRTVKTKAGGGLEEGNINNVARQGQQTFGHAEISKDPAGESDARTRYALDRSKFSPLDFMNDAEGPSGATGPAVPDQESDAAIAAADHKAGSLPEPMRGSLGAEDACSRLAEPRVQCLDDGTIGGPEPDDSVADLPKGVSATRGGAAASRMEYQAEVELLVSVITNPQAPKCVVKARGPVGVEGGCIRAESDGQSVVHAHARAHTRPVSCAGGRGRARRWRCRSFVTR